MKITCTNCALEFELPGDDWKDSVTCPKCRGEIHLHAAQTVKYTDIPKLSPPGGEVRPSSLREDEILPAGALVGPYRIEKFVGRGGMGTVYRAEHGMLQRTVALKVLPPKFAADPEFVERFKREAKALANLSHPNIVSVHDMGVQGEIYFFAMEFVDGVSLRDVLAQKKLAPEDALKIIPQLCEALEYAHSQGIIHRDIKPENILLDKHGRPKIADFGLAKIVKGESTAMPLTRTNVVMGTVEYMAPEQRESIRQVDHRADIYSLGVVLYEMLTGQLPVGKFDMPSRKVQVDVRIDGVVLKALEQDPEKRYQRAGHMGTAVSGVSPSSGAIPIVDVLKGIPLGTVTGALKIRTGDRELSVLGWDKPEFGVESEEKVSFEGQILNVPGLWRDAQVRVFVPKGTEVEVESKDAEVAVKDTRGKIKVSSSEGSVKVERHQGSLWIGLKEGELEVSGLKSGDLEVRTVDGDIRIEGWELIGGKAAVESRDGSISIGLHPMSSARYTLQTDSGSLSSAAHPGARGTASGVLGTGAAALLVRSSTGDVEFRCENERSPEKKARLPKSWRREQLEKIGIYSIVCLALFVYFAVREKSLTVPITVAVFWGMWIGIGVWKGIVRG